MTTPTEPMSDERIAEIHEREQAATTGPWSGYGSKPFEVFQEPGPSDEDSVYVTHGSDREADAEFIVAARQDIPDLLNEVERLRQKVAKDHDELRDKRTDLLNIRGILSPQPSVGDRVVPMPLGAEVAPAVEWLTAEVERLRAELARRCDRDGDPIECSHEAARGHAEAERDRLAEQVQRVRDLAVQFREREAELKERHDRATDDARATALLSAAALTGDAAKRLENALDGEVAS